MDIKINGKGLLGVILLSSSFVLADIAHNLNNRSVDVEKEILPVGTVLMWGTTSYPNGWIEMNGQSISNYSELSNIYGSNVPDLRGEFVRGWDNGRGIDANRVLGSFQDQEFKSHSHAIATEPDGTGGNGVSRTSPHGENGTRTTKLSTGEETRPRNIALTYIVKAF